MGNYHVTNWQNGVTPINANNLNNIETGISENLSAISQLFGGMKFMGVTSSIDPSSFAVPPQPGHVYQVDSVIVIEDDTTTIGDLIVYGENNKWHIIPSGDDAEGTVTRIDTSDGISGGPIISNGTIQLDPTYIASPTRSGLLSSELYSRLVSLPDAAFSGKYSDLLDDNNPPQKIGTYVHREFYQNTGTDAEGFMSQKAITDALNLKSNDGHIHTTSDITSLNNLLATEGGSFTKAASNSHKHGRINTSGYLTTEDSGGDALANNYLKSDANGKIVGQSYIPSGDIKGWTFTNQVTRDGTTSNETVNILTLQDFITALSELLPMEGESGEETFVPIAAEEHEHNLFYSVPEGVDSEEFIGGFTPHCDEDHPENYVLKGDGSWALKSDGLVTEEKNEFVKVISGSQQTLPVHDDSPDGQLKIAILSSEPDDNFEFKENWLYLIQG